MGSEMCIRDRFSSFRNVNMKKVTVKMPHIGKIEASSAASVLSKNTLQGESIELETSSAASMHVDVESDNISCNSSSGSSIDIKGKALKVQTSASSGSSIEAGKLLANDVNAEVSSGAVISVHPILSLKAQASSGGNINYNNVPKTIDKTASSGGSVSQS